MSIDRKQKRFEMLAKLYEETEGRLNERISLEELGQNVGLSPDDAFNEAVMLYKQGLVTHNGHIIGITAEGVELMESAVASSQKEALRQESLKVEEQPMRLEPIEIKESLARFRKDHPDSKRVAFILMEFGSTSAHSSIVDSVKFVLQTKGIMGLRADDKEYHSNLLYNVLTYLYGCSFGVAIYERIENDKFNANVALEVGYMMAIGKPVCLLKDKTLSFLPSDLAGELYKSFNILEPAKTIQPVLTKWLEDKGLPGDHPVRDVPSVPQPRTAVAPPEDCGVLYIEARLEKLSDEDRKEFEDLKLQLDLELKKMSRRSRGLTITLPKEKGDLIQAIRDIYNEAGWLVMHPAFEEGQYKLTIQHRS